MLNLSIKRNGVWEYVTCDEALIRLDAYELTALYITEEDGRVRVKHNDELVVEVEVEEP